MSERQRVTGIGGVFFKSRDPEALSQRSSRAALVRFAWIYDPDGNKIELWQPS